MKFSSISKILGDAKNGKMFILVDDERRENEGDLIVPAAKINAKLINFMAKYGRGLICLTLCQKQADKLNLSLMSPNNISRSQTAFTVSIDAKFGVTTGISAHDRYITIKKAIQKKISSKFFVSPGHARTAAYLRRRGARAVADPDRSIVLVRWGDRACADVPGGPGHRQDRA